jgi:hypothetical protein
MQQCIIKFTLTGEVRFAVSEGEEETAEEIVEQLEDGNPPNWLEARILENLAQHAIEWLSVDQTIIKGREPLPEEELNFYDE